MKKPLRYGMLLIVSGPSGSGKSTLAKRMFERFTEMEFSVSCTTRTMRSGEVAGRDYHFLSEEQFRRQTDFLVGRQGQIVTLSGH